MDWKTVFLILKELGAIKENDHFVYASGYHGSMYIAKEMLYVYPEITYAMCEEIAKLCSRSWEIDCIVGPEKGAMILAQLVGYILAQSTGRQIISLFAEKVTNPAATGNAFMFKPEYGKLVVAKNVLIVEDVINTGKTVQDVVLLVRGHGGIVKAVGALCNRGGMTAEEFDFVPKLFALLNILSPFFSKKIVQNWLAVECPLCSQDIPVNTEFGHGKEFLERMGRQ